ncbi:MAG: dihydrolipoamide acetyltransferase family protein [Actinomycetota bacterium]|nr:dihydrolipoamide acetyltransferase family protein [Actinomycetota bacterium]
MTQIEMPQLGETVTEGTITAWRVAPGGTVAAGDVLFEVSTDKVDSEVPSPVAGVLAEVLVPVGETVPVGAVLAVVEDEAVSAVVEDEAVSAVVEDEAVSARQELTAPTPASEHTGEAAGRPNLAAGAPVAPELPARPPIASPIVRRLASRNGLDLSTLVGTGPSGRVTRSDVERAIDGAAGAAPAPNHDGTAWSGVAATAPTPSMPLPVPQAPSPVGATPAASPVGATPAASPVGATPEADLSGLLHDGDVVEPLNAVRQITAARMATSKSTSPHVMTAVEVDYEAVERVRRSARDRFRQEEGFALTYLPFICCSLASTLRQYPRLNASFAGDRLVLHRHVDIAVAVDLDHDGLVAPVVRGADDKRVRALAREVADLAARARSRRLSPDELTGGTFTVSSSGSFGTFMVMPVINQPQVAILSTDGIARRPVVVTDENGDESIAIHSVGMLVLSWDHRAFDGAYAAAFMRDLKADLERRDWSAEL